jgi:hypothetical protein
VAVMVDGGEEVAHVGGVDFHVLVVAGAEDFAAADGGDPAGVLPDVARGGEGFVGE